MRGGAAIALAGWFAGACGAAAPVGGAAPPSLAGFTAGMTVEAARANARTLTGVTSLREKRLEANTPATARPGAISIDFADGRHLDLAFARCAAAPRLADAVLTVPAPALSAKVERQLLEPYGKPDTVLRRGPVTLYGWRGTVGDAGAITPLPGAPITIRAEKNAGSQLDVELTDHRLIDRKPC